MVLLGEKLGGGHDGRLVSILNRKESGKEADDCLAAADVALQQPMHLPVAAHVGKDLADCPVLSRGETIGKILLETARQLAPIPKRDTAPLCAGEGIAATMEDVDKQELLEGQPRAAAHCFGNRLWPVNHAERFGERWHRRRPKNFSR